MNEPYLKIVDNRGRKIPVTALTDSIYEGSATGRRMSTWGTNTAGPSASLYGSLNRLRSRTRELIRNNPLIQGASIDNTANAISSGIFPRWDMEDKILKKDIQDLWKEFVKTADYYGVSSLYGIQALEWQGLLDAGEMLCRKIPRSASLGLPVPLQFQLLEADHLDETYNTVSPSGNEIRMGIEINRDNQRVAYWIWSEHPGESYITQRAIAQRVSIPAYDIEHIYLPIRAGQMRGRPWMSAIIVKCHEYDQYDDAELVRKKGAAMFGGYFEEEGGLPAGDPSAFFGRSTTTDDANREIAPLEPGSWLRLPRGVKVNYSKPADVGENYDVYNKQQLRQISRGIPGETYEQLTGDLSGVNYSSIRAGSLSARRIIEFLQREVMIFKSCQSKAAAFMDAAVISGILPIRDYYDNRGKYLKIDWRPDGWPWVDPVKDQLADQMAVRNGFKSRSAIIAKSGGDAETVDREISEDNSRADALGLIYDSDPRQTQKSGAIQAAADQTVVDSTKT
ncbi:MAG: phage portal protein [Syntrophales bacterium]|jgi:lambda family phage portal protein|nr:phage portal protein [Syntrophales bacterium]